jgi:DNA modification methylase
MTTAIVCERLERSFLGIELNPAYVEIAKRRIREARAEKAPVVVSKRKSCDQQQLEKPQWCAALSAVAKSPSSTESI